MWGVSLTRPMLFPVGSFSCIPCAVLCGECVLHTLCYLMRRICLTHPVLFYVGSLSYTPSAISCWEILTCPMLLFYVGSFSYMPHAVLCVEFLLHTPCCFMWRVSLTHSVLSVLFYVRSFSYTPLAVLCGEFYMPHAILCGEFLLHRPCCFMWGITHPVLFYVVSFFYITGAFLCRKIVLHAIYHLISGICLTHPMQVFMCGDLLIVCLVFFRVKSFFYTPHAVLCG